MLNVILCTSSVQCDIPTSCFGYVSISFEHTGEKRPLI